MDKLNIIVIWLEKTAKKNIKKILDNYIHMSENFCDDYNKKEKIGIGFLIVGSMMGVAGIMTAFICLPASLVLIGGGIMCFVCATVIGRC